MIKRAIAISLLSIANIVLLAMAVMPHHHHGDVICFVSSHCEGGNNCGYEHSTACNCLCCQENSQHEHSTDANCCNVSHWLLFNIGHDQRSGYDYHSVVCDNDNDLFVALLPEFSEPDIQPVNLPFRQTPTTETYLQIFVSCTYGLRAPPFC